MIHHFIPFDSLHCVVLIVHGPLFVSGEYKCALSMVFIKIPIMPFVYIYIYICIYLYWPLRMGPFLCTFKYLDKQLDLLQHNMLEADFFFFF